MILYRILRKKYFLPPPPTFEKSGGVQKNQGGSTVRYSRDTSPHLYYFQPSIIYCIGCCTRPIIHENGESFNKTRRSDSSTSDAQSLSFTNVAEASFNSFHVCHAFLTFVNINSKWCLTVFRMPLIS